MKAVLLKRTGRPDRLRVVEIPTPVPESAEILVRVVATSVTRGDVIMRKMPRLLGRVFGEAPRDVPGFEFAGEVYSIGEDVTEFRVGDRVFGTTTGLRQGAYAEFVAVREDAVVAHLPPGVGFAEGAVLPVGAMTAVHFLREARVGPGQRLLVTGASGSVGSYAVQIGKDLGAWVAGVSGPSKVGFVESLGVDEVIDYSVRDFSQGAVRYDVVFDAAGRSSRKNVAGVLADGGRFVTTRSRRKERVEELTAVRDMLAAGTLSARVDRVFQGLEELPAAHRYVETGSKRGHVAVVMEEK